ncbi:hypothetical protein P8452_54530 [Trifolium repens]|nr:hypothetical protein P8452_54530 [Trifolium repens]
MERLYQWKIALNQAANIAGYDFKIGSDMKEYEHTFIGDIVQDVSNKINQAPLHVVDCPVGLESRPLLKNQRLLDVEEELQHRMNKLRHDIKSCEYEFGGNSPNKIKKMDYLKSFKWARLSLLLRETIKTYGFAVLRQVLYLNLPYPTIFAFSEVAGNIVVIVKDPVSD